VSALQIDPRAARVLRLAWPVALVASIWFVAGRLGFAILDEGLIASYSRRILSGEVPHSDIISARPFGTAIIHFIDLALPLPLFVSIRLVGIVEVVAYSLLFATFIFDRGPLRWTLTESLAVAASALVNLHTFPLMSWYTSDGLVSTAAGLVLARSALRSGSRPQEAAAMICLGLGATVKQSFVPAAIAGVLILAQLDGRDPRALARGAVRRVALAAIPIALYLGVLAVLGAFPDAISQMTSGRAVWGRSLFEAIGVIGSPSDRRAAFSGHFPFEVALVFGALLWATARRRPQWLRPLLEIALVAVIVELALHQRLNYANSWSIELTWALAVVTALARIVRGSWSGAGLAMLLVAWMTTLSWGDELPALVGGSVALCTVAVALGEGRRLPARPIAAVVAAAAFVAISIVWVGARRDFPYYDRQASQLTFDLGTVDHDFDGIKTNPVTGAYVRSIPACVHRYPAHNVAVLPDNPGLYAAFGLHNPFPIDWFLPNDYAGHSGQIVAAAGRLQARGNYLVLFQVASGFELAGLERLPVATRHSAPVMANAGIYDPVLAQQLINILRGRHILCGPFLGIYARSTGDSSSTGEPPRRSDSVAASSTATT
jgi:hypothetical protein